MSWAIRAHIRNVMLKASLGASFASSAELKKGSAALCSVDMCPYPGFQEGRHHAPPTDDPKFSQKQLQLALERFSSLAKSLSPKAEATLRSLCVSSRAADLVGDLFWHTYLNKFGMKFASRSPNAGQHLDSFRSVLTDMFLESDADGSGEVDASELAEILSHLGVQLPIDICSDLINLVDDNGNGLLELDEFLQMMCVEVIADCSLDVVEQDIKRYRARCCQLWCEVVSPFTIEIGIRDQISPVFCRILSSAVLSSFTKCFLNSGSRDIFDLEFRVQLEESLSLMFLGARRPHPAPPVSRPQSATSGRQSTISLTSPERPSTSRLSATRMRSSFLTSRLSTVPSGSDPEDPPCSSGTSSSSEEEDADEDVAAILTRMRMEAKPHIYGNAARNGPSGFKSPSRVKDRFRNRDDSHVLQMYVPELPLKPRAPGQPPPKKPIMNMLGHSEAFNTVFPTNPPTQRLRTLQKEHYASMFREGKYIERRTAAREAFLKAAAACAPAPSPPEDREEEEFGHDDTTSRLVAKHARKAQRELALARYSSSAQAKAEAQDLSSSWSALKPYIHIRGGVREDQPELLLKALQDLLSRHHRLIGGEGYRQLKPQEKVVVRKDSTDIGKCVCQLERDLAYRSCRRKNEALLGLRSEEG